MNRLFALLLLFVIACSGRSPGEVQADPAAEKVKTIFGASDYSIDYIEAISSTGQPNAVHFTLNDVKLPQFEDERELLTSSIVFNLFEEMPDSVRKQQEFFRVAVKNGDTLFSRDYSMEEVALASLFYHTVDAFFEQVKGNDSIRALDERFFPDSAQQKLRAFIKKNSMPNETSTRKINGFRMIYNLNMDEELLIYWVEEDKKWKTGHFIFTVSRKKAGIVDINVQYY